MNPQPDFSKFSSEFLEKTVTDVEAIFYGSGLDQNINMKITTFINQVQKAIDKKEEENDV